MIGNHISDIHHSYNDYDNVNFRTINYEKLVDVYLEIFNEFFNNEISTTKEFGFTFKIVNYSITGDKKLGNQIYSKLYNLSQTTRNTSEVKNIYILINVFKEKNATAKNSAGKILAYKINLSTTVIVENFTTGNQILNENFASSSSYKVQDKHSETIRLENRAIENLINKI